ncbi:MAG: tetratricopeptide repeat protein [Deltaproteobacteria bacterium]|nr:tetratricopeptide repeat protein [Deltaproteobacteria bacterium]
MAALSLALIAVPALFAACASKEYVPTRQTIKVPEKKRADFSNVSPAALNLHREAITRFEAGDYPEAARRWMDALKAGARDADFQMETHYNIGVTFLRMAKFILAEQHFRKPSPSTRASPKFTRGSGRRWPVSAASTKRRDRLNKPSRWTRIPRKPTPGITGISIAVGNF